MSQKLTILFFGDVMGSAGRRAVENALVDLRPKYSPHVVIANIENASHGRGITRKHVDEMLRMGVDILTSGNHIWDQKDAPDILEKYSHKLTRPGNYPSYPDLPCPGTGILYYRFQSDTSPLCVVNVQGRVFMEPIDCPFGFMDHHIDALKSETPLIFVDFHGQASSEKMAFAHYFDGEVSAIVGSHTHVQTADSQIFPKGTAYITDAGLCGSQYSIIGMRPTESLFRMRTKRPMKFEVADERVEARGVMLELDRKTGQALRIEPFQIPL